MSLSKTLHPHCLVLVKHRKVEHGTPERGRGGGGFNPHSGCRVVSLSKKHLPPKKVLVIPRKRWLRPDMTENLLTGM